MIKLTCNNYVLSVWCKCQEGKKINLSKSGLEPWKKRNLNQAYRKSSIEKNVKHGNPDIGL